MPHLSRVFSDIEETLNEALGIEEADFDDLDGAADPDEWEE